MYALARFSTATWQPRWQPLTRFGHAAITVTLRVGKVLAAKAVARHLPVLQLRRSAGDHVVSISPAAGC